MLRHTISGFLGKNKPSKVQKWESSGHFGDVLRQKEAINDKKGDVKVVLSCYRRQKKPAEGGQHLPSEQREILQPKKEKLPQNCNENTKTETK